MVRYVQTQIDPIEPLKTLTDFRHCRNNSSACDVSELFLLLSPSELQSLKTAATGSLRARVRTFPRGELAAISERGQNTRPVAGVGGRKVEEGARGEQQSRRNYTGEECGESMHYGAVKGACN